MPRVSRSRVINASPERVWELVSDPHNLPRWWPRATRVEDVREEDGQTAWTMALETERGSAVRADYRGTSPEPGSRFGWRQQLEGTPFERILRSSSLEVLLRPEGLGTGVTLEAEESLRGLSRLGSPMMSGAAKRRLDDALDGIERALVGEPA
jgi:uncharacterized protein YndB with AHSA1/START domain